jgi:hypothetical protein
MGRAWRLSAMAGIATGLLAAAGCSPGPLEVATLSSGTLTNGLVAYWPLDEGNGTLADDESGNGHNGIIAGPMWVPGQFGSALQFSGPDYLSAGGFPAATASYSVSAWVFIEPYATAAPIANIVSTDSPGGGWALYATFGPGNEGYEFHFFSPGGPQGYASASCNTCFVPASWVHLAAVVDGEASTLTLYVNGVAVKMTATTSAILPGSSTLYVGRSAELNPTFPLTGEVDEIAIYSRALVGQEVARLAQAPLLPTP